MSDDDKSIDLKLIYNQRLVTYNKLQDIKPMVLNDPWDDYKNKQLNTYMKI